eukprot:1966852-Pleurochrysis_carterae.AAC.1
MCRRKRQKKGVGGRTEEKKGRRVNERKREEESESKRERASEREGGQEQRKGKRGTRERGREGGRVGEKEGEWEEEGRWAKRPGVTRGSGITYAWMMKKQAYTRSSDEARCSSDTACACNRAPRATPPHGASDIDSFIAAASNAEPARTL